MSLQFYHLQSAMRVTSSVFPADCPALWPWQITLRFFHSWAINMPLWWVQRHLEISVKDLCELHRTPVILQMGYLSVLLFFRLNHRLYLMIQPISGVLWLIECHGETIKHLTPQHLEHFLMVVHNLMSRRIKQPPHEVSQWLTAFDLIYFRKDGDLSGVFWQPP